MLLLRYLLLQTFNLNVSQYFFLKQPVLQSLLFLKSLSIFVESCLKYHKNVFTFFRMQWCRNAEYATNQISTSPPPPSQNDSVCSPSYSSPAKRRHLNFMSPVKSPSSLSSKSYKSELIGQYQFKLKTLFNIGV